jgi:hypothetical protein
MVNNGKKNGRHVVGLHDNTGPEIAREKHGPNIIKFSTNDMTREEFQGILDKANQQVKG